METAWNDKTTRAKKEAIDRKWHLVDMQGQVLGRASTGIAMILMGKTKPTYTPSVDCGDFVIAVNADKVHLTGNKLEQKIYFHHTAHPGGGRSIGYKKLMSENPQRALQISVKRMLPKTRLASRQILRLKIYKGSSHPHLAQNPQPVTFA
ncbi:MAG: 50S ribosomal protein L13 [Elusimicrobia bacterium]|nr:50S ribosomal protein L13 [Elusimicrobiota bacterium]